jgi:hypothetical protein
MKERALISKPGTRRRRTRKKLIAASITALVMLSTQIVSSNVAVAVPPACKSKTPAFKEVSERTLLLMKRDIHQYDKKRFALRALVQSFYNEQGVEYFDAYWVGKGSGSVSFGTRGMLAYGIGDEALLKKIVEGDLIYAKVVVQPESEPPTTKPIFLLCSLTRIKQ